MAATKRDLSQWFDAGVAGGASHMIVVVDQFDWSDFPVYVGNPAEVASEVRQRQAASMQDVMEVYDLRGSKLEQMLEHRAWRVPG